MKIRFVTQNFLRLFFIFFFCFLYLLVAAQIPSDLRNIKASQITDSQLQQYLNQARAQGIDANELEAELLRRGLPSSEMSELKIRIQQLMPAGTNLNKDLPENTENDNKRSIPKSTTAPYNLSTDVLTKRSLIFGAELFSNSNLSFEPDLRMATPKNYVIGPDDELLLNIYGVNISQQKLKVSPEGTVNVR